MSQQFPLPNPSIKRDDARQRSIPYGQTLGTIMKALHAAIFVFLSALSAVAVASPRSIESPPNWPGSDNIEPTTPLDPISPLHMGVFTVVLEQTTLSEVVTAVGLGELSGSGDAADSLTWLCYTISSTSPKQRIWLSSGELGGGVIIDGISATQLPANVSASAKCPELPGQFNTLSLAGGIWLGASSNSIKTAMGKPKISGNTWFYIYFGKDQEFDVTGSAAIELSRGKAKSIYLNHVTTN